MTAPSLHTIQTTPARPREGSLTTPDGHRLPLTVTRVKGRAAGPVAEVNLEQRFVNDGEAALEVRYAFPLPAGASVHRLTFQIDDRIVEAIVKTKAEARATYEAARSAGRTATLLEEDEPSLFAMSIANIPAGACITVRLAYHELLRYDDGRWRFVFPLVAPERYREVAAADPGSHHLAPPRVPTGTRVDRVELELELEADHPLGELRCATHAVEVVRNGDRRAVIRLSSDGEINNRDFVLTYRASDVGVRPIVRFERTPGADGTFVAVITPADAARGSERRKGKGELGAITCGNCGGLVGDPASIIDLPGVGPAFPCGFCGAILAPSPEGRNTRASRPRDVAILVDRSASMRASLPTARRAVGELLKALALGDAVQLIAFDHERLAFDGDGTRFVAASKEVGRRIDHFLEGIAPRGGTELERALAAIDELPKRADRTRLVVLVTDAAVGNTAKLVRRAEALEGDGTRVYALGLGPAVDRRLIDRLATAGGGAADFLDETGAQSGDADMAATMARFARRVVEAGPVLTSLALSFEGAEVEELYPASLPDLYAGQPVRVLGRYRGAGPAKLVLTGTTAQGAPFRQQVEVQVPEAAEEAPGITRLWARACVETLGDRIDAGRGDSNELRARATEVALAHHLVTRFTSLVAEDQEVVTDGEPRRVEVPTPSASPSPTRARVEVFAEATEAESAPMACPAPTGRTGRAGRAGRAGMIHDSPDHDEEAYDRMAVASVTAGYAPAALSATRERKLRRKPSGVLGTAARAAGRLLGSRGPDRRQQQAITQALGSENYQADELKWLASRKSGELDLVFLVDETGSMGPYIEQVKARLLELVSALEASPLCKSLRLGLVTYRDHPPQDHSFASRSFALTTDVASIEKAVRSMRASGGGDGPEAVTDGLYDVVRMAWRPAAAKAVVWFGDAPPHGVEPSGDGFPMGCPCGNHWFAQAESCREMGVAIYAVGCLPGLSGYLGAEAVFRKVAETTRGTYLPLMRAELLVPLIAGAALTELDKQRIDAHLSDLVEGHRPWLKNTDEAERVRWLTHAMKTRGVRPRSLRGGPGHDGAASLAFREITTEDVSGALNRLRIGGTADL